MSAPRPETFEQDEPFTVRLRGILTEYPPGVSILKEMLQNADDAGAKLIKYILDTSSYPTKYLVDPGLAEHQGPALLVYNDAVFSEDDFTSLKRLGDSVKMQKKLATGKFGLGFNSVYGWTDTPSIISGTSFIALSPHKRLADGRRGYRWDFVKDSATHNISDQLAAFARVAPALSKEFLGTIVRIPFRTQEQAKTSEISNLSITPYEAMKYFEEFQSDVTESLGFLKNIERVEFYFDETKLGSTHILNPDRIRPMRASIARAISTNSSASQGGRFEIHREYKSWRQTQSYHVQQRVFDMETLNMSKELRTWATNEKVVSWIALAAPLHGDLSDRPPASRVFVTLPLPIHLDCTRVNVHGIFALNRDRRSLWTDNDNSEMNEVLWNKLLVENLMPVVWHDLLLELIKCEIAVYDYFPLMPTAVGSLFNSQVDDLLKRIVDTQSAIWRSTKGDFLLLQDGFLVAEKYERQLLRHLHDLTMPIFNDVPDKIIKLIRPSQYHHTFLTPSTVRAWLRGNISSNDIRDSSMAMDILEYVSKDEQMDQLYGLPLFACKDGKLRSLSKVASADGVRKFNGGLYIGTQEEARLFDKDGQYFLLENYPPTISARIQTHISTMSTVLNLENFDLPVFERYMRDVVYANSNLTNSRADSIEIWACGLQFSRIQRLWNWLDSKKVEDVMRAVESLWLIPLLDGQSLRKITQTSKPIMTCTGVGGDLITEIYKACNAQFPLVDATFQVAANGYLRSKRRVVDPTDLEALLHWITPAIIEKLDDSLKDRFRAHILCALRRRLGIPLNKHDHDLLSKLPVFKKFVPCEGESGSLYRMVYSSITKSRSYPLPQVPCVPIISDTDFFDASNDEDRKLFSFVGHHLLPAQKLLTDFVIPNIGVQPNWLLDPLIEFIFDEVPFAGRGEVINMLQSRPFVSVFDKTGHLSTQRLKPSEVIDRTSGLADLYFDDEQVFQSEKYSAGAYRQNLILLGMKCLFDDVIAGERIRQYHSRDATDPEVVDKCGNLLTLLNGNEGKFDFKDEWLPLMRIPAARANQQTALSPSECRPKSFAPLVEGVLGTVDIHVQRFLYKAFGWDADIEPNVVASRIGLVISLESSSDVQLALYPVLEYLNTIASRPDGNIAAYVSAINSTLSSRPWLPGSIEGLWPTEHVFFEGARAFEPYLSELPIMWSKNFSRILKLFGVANMPNPTHLAEFISTLDSTAPLSDANMNAVILALQKLDSDSSSVTLPKLMVPDLHGYLLQIDEFRNSNAAGDESFVRYAHPRVPPALAFNYSVPQFKGDLADIQSKNGPDIFEEYSQEENMVTRISKQVQESTLWLSFNEFVANAEDSGSASKVIWTLDTEKCKYPTTQIFCPELKAWQTPGLYVYNDGVFSDSDFKALVNVGMGSKSEDTSKIGKYGLGALTMYLFTDVPSIISGEYFIIFDPTRKYLPIGHRHKKRQAGLRIRLSQMKERFSDHLVPFVGIGGYTLDETSFKGTIFRFPIRNKQQYDHSPFTFRSATHAYESLKKYLEQSYLDQAKRSLIMLKYIKCIDFQLKRSTLGRKNQSLELRWRVSSFIDPAQVYKENDDGERFRQIESYTMKVTTENGKSVKGRWNWLVVKAVIRDEGVLPSTLRKFAAEERLIATARSDASSVPDVAVAAPIASEIESSLFYNSLPLDLKCGLPVNFHGRFAISPDRRSLRRDDKGGEWNKFLAEGCLSKIYYIFLERLRIVYGNTVQYYAFWPPSEGEAQNETGLIHSAFWNQIRTTSRRIFIDFAEPALLAAISQTIFDRRPSSQPGHRMIPSLIKRIQPSHVVVNHPLILGGLFDQPNSENAAPVTCLEPDYVRSLLRENSSKETMTRLAFNDRELRALIQFLLITGSVKDLEGCRILRLDDGKLAKVSQSLTPCLAKYRYLIDAEGFTLFNKIGQGCLISPNVLTWEMSNGLQLPLTFNVQRIDGSVLDRLLKSLPIAENIKTFPKNNSAWINDLYKYVIARKFSVDSYQTFPMLPLTKRNTFVSMKAWDQLRVLPPTTDVQLREICDALPDFYVLEDLKLEAMAKQVTVSDKERFLDCLYQLVKGECKAVEEWLRKRLTLNQLEYLKVKYVEFYRTRVDTSQGISLNQISVLKHMPVWRVRNTNSTISAVNALLLPDDDLLPGVRPPGPFVLREPEIARDLIVLLGGKMLDGEEYLSKHVVPYITAMNDDPNRYRALGKLLFFMNLPRHTGLLDSPFAKSPLVPNRGGEFCRAKDLYNPAERIFRVTFTDDSKYPHPDIDINSLKKLGFNSEITKKNFKACLESLDGEYGTGGSMNFYHRAREVWQAFGDRLEKIHELPWTAEELTALADYHFVPARQCISDSTSYRDGKVERGGRGIVGTMNEVIESADMPIAWTQRLITAEGPAGWTKALFNFRPTVIEVVKHLVELTTVVAPKCDLAEEEFFQDLKATYDYLNDHFRRHEAGAILKEKYEDKCVWLNEDCSLDDISKTRSQGLSLFSRSARGTIGSLSWLRTKALVHGVSYDTPTLGLYAVKSSIHGYDELLRASGSSVVNYPVAVQLPENIGDHSDIILQSLRAMRETESLCDMTIIVDGRRFIGHRAVLAAVSSFFRSLASSNEWRESLTGKLNLDNTPYANAESVFAVLEWVYNGDINVDDTHLENNEVVTRLDHYLDILQLSDVWDIPLLRTHIENRIIRNAVNFIRIENVREVGELTKGFNAQHVEEYCQQFCNMNRHIVEIIESAPAQPTAMTPGILKEPGCMTHVKRIFGNPRARRRE